MENNNKAKEIMEEITKAAKETGKATKAGNTTKATKTAGKAGKAGKTTKKSLTETAKEIAEEKEREIKFRYGIGGQTFSIVPILLDKRENPFLFQLLAGTQAGRIPAQTFQQWAQENGTINIIPIVAGGKTYYTVTVNPAKPFKLQTWELDWGTDGASYLQYTKAEQAEEWTIQAGEQVITNITTNRGKAVAQAKELGKLFKMDYSKADGMAKGNHYQLEGTILKEIGKNSGRPTGKEMAGLENLTKHQPWEKMAGQFR